MDSGGYSPNDGSPLRGVAAATGVRRVAAPRGMGRIAPALHLGAAAALAVALALLVGACGAGEEASPLALGIAERGPETPITVPAGEPIVIGVSSALTGPIGLRGTEYRDAVIVSVNRWKDEHGTTIEGHEIEIQAEDDGCTESDVTLGAAMRLLSRAGLVGVLGPQCSAGADVAIPLYNDAATVAISGSATTSALTDEQPSSGYFFRTAFRNDFEGELTGQFIAEELGAKTVFLVDDGETYGADLSASALRELEQRGVEVLRATIGQGQVDFSELVGEIAARKPDFVGFAGFNPEAALFYGQLRDAGYTGPFGAGDAAASERDFVGPVGAELAEGVYFAGCSLDGPEDFAADFRNVRGSEPTAAFVAHYADAATILLDAIARVARPQADGSLVIEPAQLREAVAAADLTGGVSGHVTFDERGDRATDARSLEDRADDLGLVVCQVRDGRMVTEAPEG